MHCAFRLVGSAAAPGDGKSGGSSGAAVVTTSPGPTPSSPGGTASSPRTPCSSGRSTFHGTGAMGSAASGFNLVGSAGRGQFVLGIKDRRVRLVPTLAQ